MAQWFRQALLKTMAGEVDWDTDDIRLTLHTSTYVPDLDAHAYVSALTGELTTANGYTAGGVALTTEAITYTAANSWATQWAGSTAYTVDHVVRPTTGNGRLYRVAVAGTSAATQPTWPTTVGLTVVDGGVTWECVGSGIIVFDADDVVWASPSTFGPYRYGVLSDRTPATAATQPLLGLVDYGSDQTAQGGAVTQQWNTQGILHVFAP